MIHVVVSVFDSAAEVYGPPMLFAAAGAAVRSFSDAINGGDKSSAVAQHPDDFVMFKIGTFDDVKGEFLALEHVQIARGKDLDLVS